MALQGTLDTFALPDVLRLLAATKKTGRLRIDGDRGTGSTWVSDGAVTAVEAARAPRATDLGESLFELLRFEAGSFSFDADADPQGVERSDVEQLLERAEALLAEWREIEAVVPSLTSWVTLTAALPGDEVTVDRDRWRTLVAVGSGRTVGAIGDELDLAELAASRAVRDLLELGVASLEARAPEPVPAEVPAVPAETETETAAAGVDAAAEHDRPTLTAVPGDDDDAPSSLPGPRARRPRARRTAEATEEPGAFVPLELNQLQPQASYDTEDGGDVSEGELAAAFPGLAAQPSADDVERAADVDEPTGDEGADDLGDQLANLSPRAAAAVKAAASAETDEARDAALQEAEGDEEPLDRGLLLKFLSSVKS